MRRTSKVRTFAFVVLMGSVVGCGMESSTDVGQDTQSKAAQVSPEVFQAQLQSTFNAYNTALLSSDEVTVRRLLSSERLQRIDSVGNTGEFVRREQGKLRRFLEGANELGEGFVVKAVHGTAADPVVAAELSYLGRDFPKPMYFVKENGVFRLSLQVPKSVTVDLRNNPDSPFRTTLAALSTSTYFIHNRYAYAARNFKIQINGVDQQFQLAANGSTSKEGDDTCGFFDGGSFKGQNGAGTWSVTTKCDWNYTGDDYFNSVGDVWQCTTLCS